MHDLQHRVVVRRVVAVTVVGGNYGKRAVCRLLGDGTTACPGAEILDRAAAPLPVIRCDTSRRRCATTSHGDVIGHAAGGAGIGGTRDRYRRGCRIYGLKNRIRLSTGIVAVAVESGGNRVGTVRGVLDNGAIAGADAETGDRTGATLAVGHSNRARRNCAAAGHRDVIRNTARLGWVWVACDRHSWGPGTDDLIDRVERSVGIVAVAIVSGGNRVGTVRGVLDNGAAAGAGAETGDRTGSALTVVDSNGASRRRTAACHGHVIGDAAGGPRVRVACDRHGCGAEVHILDNGVRLSAGIVAVAIVSGGNRVGTVRGVLDNGAAARTCAVAVAEGGD